MKPRSTKHMNEGKSQIILSSDHEYNTLADEWRWCPVGASQVGPGFGFRGSTLQNTIHYKAPCKTHFKTQCKAHFKTDCKVQGNTLQSTLQINGKSNNEEHTAKHTARQCDANTLESSLQNNIKYYDIKKLWKTSQNRIEKQNRVQRTLQ